MGDTLSHMTLNEACKLSGPQSINHFTLASPFTLPRTLWSIFINGYQGWMPNPSLLNLQNIWLAHRLTPLPSSLPPVLGF